MSSVVGTLLTPFVNVEWAGVNLSNVDDGNGGTIVLPQNFKVTIEEDGNAPTCDFELVPNPIGFTTFEELKTTAIDQPIKVKLGYEDGTQLDWEFNFAGMGLTTGHSPQVQVNCVSAIKGPLTDTRVSYTLEEPIPLVDLPAFLQKKVGDEDMQFEFVGKAKEDLAGVMYQENIIERTPYSILTDALRPHGIKIHSNDTVFDKKILLGYAPTVEGDVEADNTEVNTDGNDPESGLRSIHIIGPGLMENLVRKQTFGAGMTDTKTGTGKNRATSYEQEQKIPLTGGQPQKKLADASNEAGGTTGTSRIPSSMSRTEESQSKKAKDARAQDSNSMQSELTFDVLMVPYLVGIKPRDFVAIPSLDGASYVEDWHITKVSYSQGKTGEIRVSVSAERPFTGLEPLLDAPSLDKVKAVAGSLETLDDWAYFYWSGGRFKGE